MSDTKKASGASPLYAFRPVLNAETICAWAAEQGFETALLPDDMHVTVVFSRDAFDAGLSRMAESTEPDPYPMWGPQNIVVRGGARQVTPLGDGGAIVLKIESLDLQREHQMFREMGASWDYESYTPHVTITYRGAPSGPVAPFTGDIVLGPLTFRALSADTGEKPLESSLDRIKKKLLHDSPRQVIMPDKMSENTFTKIFKVIKAVDEQRIVYGWATVSTVKGELIVDSQGDIIEPDEMVKMANDFMLDVRMAKAMHAGEGIGEFIHSLPLTKDIAEALGVECEREGWIVAVKIHDDATWAAVKSGAFTGFSIGGKARSREAVE
jgi:hypothetical protein